MPSIDIQDAETQFSKLIEAVAHGQEVVIAKSGKPVAKLVPFQEPASVRKSGALKGKMRIADDFDAPLPVDLQDAFEGK
jgi:prevent-host-death family protein